MELETRLRGSPNRCTELSKLGDELAAIRKKQSAPQTSGGRPTRTRNSQALAPLIDPTNRISRPPSSHRPRQQSQPSMPPRLLELRAQHWANVQPSHRRLYPVPEGGFDAWPPPMSVATPMTHPIPSMKGLESVDTVFIGGAGIKKVRGYSALSWEHSVVSRSFAATMGKRGIETELPPQSHWTADMADMTVVVPVTTPDGWTPENVDIWAQVSDDLEGDNYILGWRARNKIDSVQNSHPSASKPGDAHHFGLVNGYVAPAAINMSTYSPPPSSAYTTINQSSIHLPQGNMDPGTTQYLPVSPFQDSFNHDMSSLNAPMNNTEMYNDVTAGAQAAPMPTGPGWANETFSTDALDTQFTTAPNPIMSGTEGAGTNGHQGGSPHLVAQHGQIRWNEIDAAWLSPST